MACLECKPMCILRNQNSVLINANVSERKNEVVLRCNKRSDLAKYLYLALALEINSMKEN